MLEFREIDYSNDIPEIVDLLRTSLSEKHTKESFKWKHIDNPFGKSLGFLALDKNKIIGVRMFMKWDFSNEGEIIHALRPVDTVTHSDYRNKGIFKKLTLDGLEKYKNNYDLIFNTPNQNSYLGNLKMGWKKYPIKINFKFALILPLLTKSHTDNPPINSDKNKVSYNYFTTNKSSSYLQWVLSCNAEMSVDCGLIISNSEVEGGSIFRIVGQEKTFFVSLVTSAPASE